MINHSDFLQIQTLINPAWNLDIPGHLLYRWKSMLCVGNSSVVKIYIIRPKTGTSCEKCNSKAFRLGIEPASSGLLDQCSTIELQKPLPTTWARVHLLYKWIKIIHFSCSKTVTTRSVETFYLPIQTYFLIHLLNDANRIVGWLWSETLEMPRAMLYQNSFL